jgi:hypothetical protein
MAGELTLLESLLLENNKSYPATAEGFEKFLDDVLEDCMPFLRSKARLYRGMKPNDMFGIKTIRKDRKPKDSTASLHQLLNLILKEKKLPLRNEVLFAVTNKNYNMLSEYGPTHRVLPVGKFKFYWFPNNPDLFLYSDKILHRLNDFVYMKGAKTVEDVKWAVKSNQQVSAPLDRLIKSLDTVETRKFPDKDENNEIAISASSYYYLPSEDRLKEILAIDGVAENQKIKQALKIIYRGI